MNWKCVSLPTELTSKKSGMLNLPNRISGESEAKAQSVAPCFFDINQQLGRVVKAQAGVERQHPRRSLFVVRTQTMDAAVESRERRMSLKDEIRLPGQPEARVFKMRQHRFGIGNRARG